MKNHMELFPQRIKMIRQTYDLSLAEMAALLNIPDRGTLYNWERGKSYPLFEALNLIADTFSISIDWLSGRSNTPYTKESVLLGEEAVRQFLIDLGSTLKYKYELLHSTLDNPFIIDPSYSDPNSRIIKYSLGVRANISILFRLVTIPHYYWYLYYRDNGFKKRGIIDKVKEALGLSQPEKFDAPNKKEITRAQDLAALFSSPQKPVYDLEKSFQDSLETAED